LNRLGKKRTGKYHEVTSSDAKEIITGMLHATTQFVFKDEVNKDTCRLSPKGVKVTV